MKSDEPSAMTIYVRSELRAVPTWLTSPEAPLTIQPTRSLRKLTGVTPNPYARQRMLPEDQATALESIKKSLTVRGIPFKVVDLGVRWRWRLRRRARMNGWTQFPVLVRPDGRATEDLPLPNDLRS